MRTNAIEICCRLIALHFHFFVFLLKLQFYIFDSLWFILIVALPNVDLLPELLNIFPSKITKMRNLRCLFYASLQNFGWIKKLIAEAALRFWKYKIYSAPLVLRF